ncbi:MAG: flagellar motor switch protein FliN [Phycisphaeraceae bacterium]
MAESETNQQNEADDAVQSALADAQASLNEMRESVEDGEAASEAAPAPAVGGRGGIELLSDVDLEVAIELGRTEMLVEDVLKLGKGSVVELDKLAGDPVDVHVNGRLVARGEVLVLNDNFCIRISEIVANLDEQTDDWLPQEAAKVA